MKLQETSYEVWAKKYQAVKSDGTLVDHTPEDTLKRVSKRLASLENDPAKWEPIFLDVLKKGAIPAGRILSNAGAEEYKPSVSTINCTVSQTIDDSMLSILESNTKAGMTLKAGCGIGYEFSTLRPKGAMVKGAGASTSGPLSFMEIFDRTCQTVSSAGGRRGAQMGTFDISHPDVEDFIKAKRTDGSLRQFNLSLLITDDFITQVKKDGYWDLYFPTTEFNKDVLPILEEVDLTTKVNLSTLNKRKGRYSFRKIPLSHERESYVKNNNGETLCQIYKTVKAKYLWDLIMKSTYDYAEPGFLLIDEINKMNNNWFCENIRATNPCVTADTRLATQYGLVKIGDLYNNKSPLEVTVDNRALTDNKERGVKVRSAVPAFMTSSSEKVWKVTTKAGYEIKATSWHDFYTQRGKIKLSELKVGDDLLIQSGKGQFGKQGSSDLGKLIGMITGDGHFTRRGNNQQTAVIGLWGKDRQFADQFATIINTMIADNSKTKREYTVRPVEIPSRNHVSLSSVILARLLKEYGFTKETKLEVPEVIWQGTESCVRAYLQALFQADGTVNASYKKESCSIRLASSQPKLLKDVQMLLSNFGVYSSIHKRRPAGKRLLPNGKGGYAKYNCSADYELIIDGQSRDQFMQNIGFLGNDKTSCYNKWVKGRSLKKTQKFSTKIKSIEYVGNEAVYDTTQKDNNTVIFNGLVTGQCGEQALPENGSCLLGSINLTKFVVDPFGDNPTFDYDSYIEVIKVFTRMLDNVVEINGLPLKEQREELENKRRHGMGYTGLGSALTMLKVRYDSSEAVKITEKITKTLAITGFEAGIALAKEKGMAPVLNKTYSVTREMLEVHPELSGHRKLKGKDLLASSHYFQKNKDEFSKIIKSIKEHGCRFTHHSSIAPTGTISLTLGNNCSNGIEPSFSHFYSRNIIEEGKKTKRKVDVYSYEYLVYKNMFPDADVDNLPDYFVSADTVSPKAHIDIQAAAQNWVDSSISKTINVATDYDYNKFKDIYLYAVDKGLKGCTTFRYNPENFQGVLVKESDLESTEYEFATEDGKKVRAKGNEVIVYEGEETTAANLYDALKEGTYGTY